MTARAQGSKRDKEEQSYDFLSIHREGQCSLLGPCAVLQSCRHRGMERRSTRPELGKQALLRARSFDLEQRPGTIPVRNDIQIYISVNEWNDSWPKISLTERPLKWALRMVLALGSALGLLACCLFVS